MVERRWDGTGAMLGEWQRRNRCPVRLAGLHKCVQRLPSLAAGEGRRLRGARNAEGGERPWKLGENFRGAGARALAH